MGRAPALARFREALERAARGNATVLLYGESGTGKGLAARLLHRSGPRARGPFVQVDLGAIAPTLIEAALFGHERGAFTDAHRERSGLFRAADGGTLVLDDVDLLAPSVQAKLLRVLQERVVEPLGAEAPVPVDVRVVATTNRDLRAEVEAGRFRGDLYYRLAVVPLELPPLRARTEDLPELARVLLGRVAARTGVPVRALSEDALARLGTHPWPGNVRELENALERALVLAPADAAVLGPEAFEFLDEVLAGAAEDLAERALAHGLTVEEVTRAMLERALEEHRGNVSAAARQVGLTRRAFDYRLARRREESGNASAEEEPGEASGRELEESAEEHRA